MGEGKKIYGRFAAISAAILFGCESVGVQLCYLNGFNISTLITGRYIIVVLIFLITIYTIKAPLLVEKPYRFKVFILGLCYTGLTWFLFSALMRIPAALAILFFYSYPSLTALIARFFYRKKLNLTRVFSLILSGFGLALLYWSSATDIILSGVIFALLAGLCNAIKLNISGEIMPKLNIFTYSFNISVVVLISALLVSSIGENFNLDVIPLSFFYLLFLAIGINYGAVLLLNKSLKTVSAVDVSIIFLLEPQVTALTAFLIFGDILKFWQLFGAILLLIAVLIPQLQELKISKKNNILK